MATRRNVAANGNGNGNGHLPPSLQAGTSNTPTENPLYDLPQQPYTSSAFNRMANGVIYGGVGEPHNFHVLAARPSSPSKMDAWEKQYYPGKSRALSGIARRAFLLGNAASAGIALTIYFISTDSLFWRLPAFMVTLSVFHFLEFWTTARYNTPSAQVSSYLLSSNGSAYTVAHTAASVECLITCLLKTYCFPLDLSFITRYFPSAPSALFPSWAAHLNIILGLFLIIMGQTIRSLAMAQAGQSFNHVVQFRKQTSHTLVTSGVYRVSRHPSYFGFFWWGLGTQLLLGNTLCFFGYAGVLWVFFKRRIVREEKYLVDFFEHDYEEYRKRVGILIPFI